MGAEAGFAGGEKGAGAFRMEAAQDIAGRGGEGDAMGETGELQERHYGRRKRPAV